MSAGFSPPASQLPLIKCAEARCALSSTGSRTFLGVC
jgi:hypothetical protein